MSVLEALMRGTKLGELTVSEWALREGIVLSTIRRHDPAELGDDPRALRRASVLSLCRRSSWRQRHAREVASIALSLFDATAELHGLSATDRELLELGSLLHDIGEHISRTDHDKHTAYLIENGGLRGFDPDEIRLLATLGRYHIRGTPRPSFAPYGALDTDGRRRAVALVALLRVADALDATHTSVVDHIELGIRRGEVTLVVHARNEAELEAWMVRRKQDLFERTFHVSLELGVVSGERREYDALAEGSGLG
jgi:exopolyphosphatase/guanosine-5'-triphosphate,3'-diphosphate pyrophosphatase